MSQMLQKLKKMINILQRLLLLLPKIVNLLLLLLRLQEDILYLQKLGLLLVLPVHQPLAIEYQYIFLRYHRYHREINFLSEDFV
jgi:hypothetical protein